MNKIIIQGIPYDEKSSFQRGPALAPPLIREILHNSEVLNLFTEQGVTIENPAIEDRGDFEISDYFEIEQVTRNHLEAGNKILTLGGDHSITFPVLKAFHEKYPVMDVLDIDAHPDLYHEYKNDPFSHASPFARVMENGFAARLVQVGIRTLNTHQAEQAEKFNVEIHHMKDHDLQHIFRFENPLYISLDMDAFDPAFAP